MSDTPFDPFSRARQVEGLVMEGSRRRYYRFRASGHYGGIVTADAAGCNLLCAYCWNFQRNLKPEGHGDLFSPEDVADGLLQIARRKGLHLFRISGSEPVLGQRSMEHLVRVIEGVASPFILETNGLVLGREPELAWMLRGLDVSARVAIKGWNEESFERITGAQGRAFRCQLRALDELSRIGVTAWPAVISEIFRPEGLMQIRDLLGTRVEVEELNRYPFVIQNLRRRGIEVGERLQYPGLPPRRAGPPPWR
jgi:uncharacterized Fe-S cluster-containing radical SAM superfamily protein